MGIGAFFKKLCVSIEGSILEKDYEADLYLVDSDRKRAKAAELEYQVYRSGESMFEIEIKNRSGIPEGDEAVVLIHGVEVARVTKLKLQTEVKLYSKNGDEVPPIELGDRAELMHNGVVIAAGVFREDD